MLWCTTIMHTNTDHSRRISNIPHGRILGFKISKYPPSAMEVDKSWQHSIRRINFHAFRHIDPHLHASNHRVIDRSELSLHPPRRAPLRLSSTILLWSPSIQRQRAA